MALVPHTQDLRQEVETVQQMRRVLHDAYIADGEATSSSANGAAKPSPVADTRRTVDGPTLDVLKSPNYPFMLCEEAPPSYVPPPVPYDVEGEVKSLKHRVLQVQEELQLFREKRSPRGAPLTESQVLEFFSSNAVFAAMAWEVSSLKWFYRWVLTHSISHLWNCKEQLEYVLSDNDQTLPQSVEEMDECLNACPFPEAVSLLDSERQAVVAQERRRLRSASRTFRERVPATAVNAATSSYLNTEEKYMYQEFFNQSEHMILLVNHTLMLNKANSAATGQPKVKADRGVRSHPSLSRSQSRGSSRDNGALLHRNEPIVGEMDVSRLVEETINAVSAEQEVIATLMRTIREREQRGETFEASAAERERSRRAQMAVYGCVLSDMSLMGNQMELITEFIGRYEQWLKLRGYETHEHLMSALSKLTGGTSWPTLSAASEGGQAGGHEHFVPPTEVMMRLRRDVDKYPEKATDNGSESEAEKHSNGEPGKQTTTLNPVTAAVVAPEFVEKHMVKSPPSAPHSVPLKGASDAAHIFYSLLLQTEALLRAEGGDQGRMSRVWLTASVRFTVVMMVRREWRPLELVHDMPRVEEELLRLVDRTRNLSGMLSVAAALSVIVTEIARLSAAKNVLPSLTVEVPIAVIVPAEVDDIARAVTYILQPEEWQRWGSFLDAIWFQIDPSAAANGDLLVRPVAADGGILGSAPSSRERTVHFLYVVLLELPPTIPEDGSTSVVMRYRLPRMSPAAETSRRAAPSVATVADMQPSKKAGTSRYLLARNVLAALFAIEARGLLPCFACRLAEAVTVPLSGVMYVSFDDANTSTIVQRNHVALLSFLPPAAIELLRVSAAAELFPEHERSTTYQEPVNMSSIGLLISALLEEMAVRSPVLSELYMTAATVREQALSDIKNETTPEAFAKATMHPTLIECAPTKARAMSIQQESITNRSSLSLRRFTSPLLRRIDDVLETIEMEPQGAVTDSNETSIKTLPSVHVPPMALRARPSSLPGRETQMAHLHSSTSPSPSAIQPDRH